MLQYLRKKHILILLHLLVLSSANHRKSKKPRDLKISPPKYEVHSSDSLPSDVQITKYLLKGNQETFSYWSTLDNGTLSVTVIPCTSSVKWSFRYRTSENSNILQGESNIDEADFQTNNVTTKTCVSAVGLYYLSLIAVNNNSYVHIYISTEIGGPQTLQTSHADNLKIHQKQRRKTASLKWNQSLVDPQSTDYCLVISSNKIYNSLCEAQATRMELPAPRNYKFSQKPIAESQIIRAWEFPKDKHFDQLDPMIACTGKKTQYTISNLREGQIYYYNLFAINKQSNLTYPFGAVSKVFRSHVKPLSLKNGFGQANLRDMEGKVVFKYKIGRDVGDDFDLFVIPCGGPVDVKIFLKGQPVVVAKKIESFRKLTVKNPRKGARYLIKVLNKSEEGFRRTTGVQVYASNKALAKIPMISEPKVKEYITMRECRNVTIGWMLVAEAKSLHYCIKVKEGSLKDMDDYKIPNQCGLENRLRKSEDYVTKYCKDIKRRKEKVHVYKIKELEPGRHYIVQVTVQKQKGITLSYDLLQVSTKRCFKRFN